jgi:hypothetical protein
VHLNECDVGAWQRHRANDRVEMDSDFVGLHQREHVGQDGGMHGESGSVRRVCDDAEHVLQDVCVVCLIEGLRGVRLACYVLE